MAWLISMRSNIDRPTTARQRVCWQSILISSLIKIYYEIIRRHKLITLSTQCLLFGRGLDGGLAGSVLFD